MSPNPLCGRDGATYVFGKQKGLNPEKFKVVDGAIKEFYSNFSPETLKQVGAGAGGGIAAGLCAFCWSRNRIWNSDLFGFDTF